MPKEPLSTIDAVRTHDLELSMFAGTSTVKRKHLGMALVKEPGSVILPNEPYFKSNMEMLWR